MGHFEFQLLNIQPASQAGPCYPVLDAGVSMAASEVEHREAQSRNKITGFAKCLR